jgi:hypothetical protein
MQSGPASAGCPTGAQDAILPHKVRFGVTVLCELQ